MYDGATYVSKQTVSEFTESYLDEAVINNAINDVINEEIQDKAPDVVRLK